MEEKNMQEQIDSINKKLDIILEEIELQKKHRREIDDLKDDLTRVGNDIYKTAVVELEEIHDYFSAEDILHLGKKLLRNVSTISQVIEQMESIKGFFQDAAPLSRESFIDWMNKLDEFDKKGYFTFIKELGNVADKVVSSFSADDVKHLGDNIVTILNTIKALTQPDMLHSINNAVHVYKNLDIEITKKSSIFSLLKEINTIEFKNGMAFAIQFLKNVANPSENEITTLNNEQNN